MLKLLIVMPPKKPSQENLGEQLNVNLKNLANINFKKLHQQLSI